MSDLETDLEVVEACQFEPKVYRVNIYLSLLLRAIPGNITSSLLRIVTSA